jgi:hypothetical protein
MPSTRTHRSAPFRPLGALLAGALVLLPGAGRTDDYRHELGFTAVKRNPWTGGPAFELERSFEDIRAGVSLTIPTTGITPTDILAQLLGIDSPIDILSAQVGGSVAVEAGIDFGLWATGGSLNINYPAVSTLSIGTVPGRPGSIRATDNVPVSALFTPGLDRLVVPSSTGLLGAIAGPGYAEPLNLPGFSISTFQRPTFNTQFPNFSVWGEAFVAGEIGVNVEARGLAVDLGPLGEVCLACKGIPLRVGVPEQRFTFVEIDPGVVRVPGLVDVQLDQEIRLPSPADVRLQLRSPNLQVTGNLQAGGTALTGSGARPVISVLGSLDDFIPVVGALLDGDIGPFGYTLASFDAGPTFGIYQDFRLEVTPRLQLAFSEYVQIGDSLTRVGNFGLDEEISFRALLSGSDRLNIVPTYQLEGRFFNETGISLGVAFDLDGPTLRAGGLGTLGPLGEDTQVVNIASLPIYDESFSLHIGAITLPRIELEKEFPALTLDEQRKMGLTAVHSVGPGSAPGTERFELEVSFEHFGAIYSGGLEAEGRILLLGGDGDSSPDAILVLDEDLISVANGYLDAGINFGNVICLLCYDWTPTLDGPNPSLEDEFGRLYLTNLFEFPNDEFCVECHPILGQDNRVFAGESPITTIGAVYDTQPIPEPTTAVLLAAGMAGLGFGGRRRR